MKAPLGTWYVRGRREENEVESREGEKERKQRREQEGGKKDERRRRAERKEKRNIKNFLRNGHHQKICKQ